VSGLGLFLRARDCDKALTLAGCDGYARWLGGEPEALPENPPSDTEAAALKAFVHSFEGARSAYLAPSLQPARAEELDDLHSRAIGAMRDRLRQVDPLADRRRGTRKRPPRAKGKRINERMLAKIQADRESLYWSSNVWKDHLSCAASTVKGSKTWKTVCLPAREEARRRRHGRRLRGPRKRERQQVEE
jgi:hypothetical protein